MSRRSPEPPPTFTLSMAASIARDAARANTDAAATIDHAERAVPGAARRQEALAAAVRQLDDARRDGDVAQRTIVDALREDGATWREIGQLLGISGSAAWQRFGPRGSHHVLS